jgi:hypothetical protein
MKGPRHARQSHHAAHGGLAPHSTEAEQSVLGGLLLDNSAWPQASGLQSTDFYAQDHGAIFAGISALIAAGAAADVITVAERLRAMGIGIDGQAGGLAYLNALAQSVPSAANMRRYVEIVRERAAHRALQRALAGDDSRGALEAARHVLERASGGGPAAELPRLDLAEAFGAPAPALDFVLPGFLAGTVGALVAPGATGKSYWALEATLSLACSAAGGDLLDLRPARTGRVVYLAGEDPEPILRARLHAIGQHLPREARADVSRHVDLVPVLGLRVDVMDDAWLHRLTQRCAGARLVVIDTLSRVHQLDENDNSAMGALMSQLEYLAVQTGAAVLYLHHVGKAAQRDGQADQQHAARGASLLIDNSRWGAYVARMGRSEAERFGVADGERWRYMRWGIAKLNYGEALPDRWYERHAGGMLLPVDFAVERVIRGRSRLAVNNAWRDMQ